MWLWREFVVVYRFCVFVGVEIVLENGMNLFDYFVFSIFLILWWGFLWFISG